jgi:uncharacterized membrane protein HdeD (DUF308 family)
MTTVGIAQPRAPETSHLWWLLLLTGFLWILIGLWVLEANYDSALLIGYMVAIWLMFAGVAEFVAIGVGRGWGWAHGILGVLFIAGGIAALTSPFQTFSILGGLFGLFLVLKGTFDFVLAIAEHRIVPLWWFTLIAGIFEIALGLWAIGYPGRSAALLILWIGLGALIRGITEIFLAFSVRRLPEEAAA